MLWVYIHTQIHSVQCKSIHFDKHPSNVMDGRTKPSVYTVCIPTREGHRHRHGLQPAPSNLHYEKNSWWARGSNTSLQARSLNLRCWSPNLQAMRIFTGSMCKSARLWSFALRAISAHWGLKGKTNQRDRSLPSSLRVCVIGSAAARALSPIGMRGQYSFLDFNLCTKSMMDFKASSWLLLKRKKREIIDFGHMKCEEIWCMLEQDSGCQWLVGLVYTQ